MSNFEVLASSFGQVHEAYDLARPGWPAALLHALALPDNSTVVEVGAGTGKLTRLLSNAFPLVVAIEPFASMAADVAASGANIVCGVAEALPLQDACADAIFAAESFHWFDQGLAAAEFARVLRPGGLAVLMWNRSAAPIAPVPLSSAWSDIERLFASSDHPLLRYNRRPWLAAFAGHPMGPFRSASLIHEQVLVKEDFLLYASTLSWVSSMTTERRESLLGQLRSDLTASEYRLLWRADIHWARRDS